MCYASFYRSNLNDMMMKNIYLIRAQRVFSQIVSILHKYELYKYIYSMQQI